MMKRDGQSGQALVEYVLLLAMLMTVGLSILQSDAFKNFMSKDGIFASIRAQLEYSYRHGSPGTAMEVDYKGGHELYRNKKTGESRFFTIIERYPN